VSIPKVGERVWYFPQGHMEQVRVCRVFIYELAFATVEVKFRADSCKKRREFHIVIRMVRVRVRVRVIVSGDGQLRSLQKRKRELRRSF
jgi:hypothetical protein